MKRALLILPFCILALCFAGSKQKAQEVVRRPIVTSSSPILTSLTAAYKLSDTTDASGRGNTLTNAGGATFNTGLIGNAVYLNGSATHYLSLAGTSADVKMGDIDFTIVADVLLSSIPSGISYSIVSKDSDSPASSRDYTLDISDPGGTGRFRFYVNGSIIVTDNAVSVTTATWYHIVAWHDATADTVNIQVNNNTAVSVSTTGTAPQNTSTEFRIGARAYSGFEDYLPGEIDNVAIWKRLLTPTEKTCLYNSGASKEYPFSGC
jgi:hypothetical protein